MKKDNKTICSYCGKRFNFDTMKYGLCSDCYEMVCVKGAITEGEYSHAITAETASCAYVKGKNSIACALGRDAWVRGELGSWLVATEWEYSEDIVMVGLVMIYNDDN